MKKLTFISPAFVCFVIFALLTACSGDRRELGTLPTGATAALTLDEVSGTWGVEISGGRSATLLQKEPVQIQLYISEDDIRDLAAGYDNVSKRGATVTGEAVVSLDGGAAFRVADDWSVDDGALVVRRTLSVEGNVPGAGFYSAIGLHTTPDVTWNDVSFLAPGLLYGDPTYDGPRSPGGTLYNDTRAFTIRQDYMPAPLYGMTLPDGGTVTMLDMAPDGSTTLEETRTGLAPGVMIDPKIAVGAFGSSEEADGSVRMEFWMPATVKLFARQPRSTALPAGTPTSMGTPATLDVPATPPAETWNRRYNPVEDGFSQNYTIGFRFADNETFPELTKNSYRWAWDVLKPTLHWHDMEVVRRSLADQLSSQVYTFDDRTGFPFIVYTHSGEVWRNERDPNFYWRATMGFVGKNIEAADQLLRESERDPGERGEKMRRQALDVIATFIRKVPMKRPASTGFNLKDGKPSMTNPPVWYVREATEDMRMLLEAYRRELDAGRSHPEWLQWCRDFADWLVPLQRADGSFPRSFMIDTSEIVEESGTTSYNVVPMFVLLSRETGDDKYLESAIRAADYVWESFGRRGVFIGGAIDNPNITDKEAGMLSMQAFLFLLDATGDDRWLERARVAGDFAATWTYLWNVPMPSDADDDALMWKRDITTVGVQGITAQVAGHVDQYLDIAVPDYVKLYRLTDDRFYLDFARILLHNCKGMMAIPGRLHGMIAPGFQTENWRMGAAREGRGFGAPEKWMPWVTTNHLYGIYSLEENDKEMYDLLTAQ